MINIKKSLEEIYSNLPKTDVDGDILDIGNEIGMGLATTFKNISDKDVVSFIVGLKHGIDLILNWNEYKRGE